MEKQTESQRGKETKKRWREEKIKAFDGTKLSKGPKLSASPVAFVVKRAWGTEKRTSERQLQPQKKRNGLVLNDEQVQLLLAKRPFGRTKNTK